MMNILVKDFKIGFIILYVYKIHFLNMSAQETLYIYNEFHKL